VPIALSLADEANHGQYYKDENDGDDYLSEDRKDVDGEDREPFHLKSPTINIICGFLWPSGWLATPVAVQVTVT
jgi:hypothetical protein